MAAHGRSQTTLVTPNNVVIGDLRAQEGLHPSLTMNASIHNLDNKRANSILDVHKSALNEDLRAQEELTFLPQVVKSTTQSSTTLNVLPEPELKIQI